MLDLETDVERFCRKDIALNIKNWSSTFGKAMHSTDDLKHLTASKLRFKGRSQLRILFDQHLHKEGASGLILKAWHPVKTSVVIGLASCEECWLHVEDCSTWVQIAKEGILAAIMYFENAILFLSIPQMLNDSRMQRVSTSTHLHSPEYHDNRDHENTPYAEPSMDARRNSISSFSNLGMPSLFGVYSPTQPSAHVVGGPYDNSFYFVESHNEIGTSFAAYRGDEEEPPRPPQEEPPRPSQGRRNPTRNRRRPRCGTGHHSNLPLPTNVSMQAWSAGVPRNEVVSVSVTGGFGSFYWNHHEH
ncbi:hypothetical protein V8G54_029578 [Vigna mungo]|uniref:Uncharacterized protein n=1 Tax=Vigna mungo TaxID=3915 RepID=A0AAQ3MU27_VIGMU